ncbi:unnamed protein product [Arabis nemorensis]|uniref:Uncharacterized protein n=1 Tax=Arabis nemorensis TaxID=586526 RepID=A0A565BF92_9BRAS|nr:unnamed protein product [Arabis nemorensis]
MKGKGKQLEDLNTNAYMRQHHTNLVEKLMPLLAPELPPGFEPSPSLVVPEVFQQMKIYMSCLDPQERSRREQLMIQTLNKLSKDPNAQSSCLRLEAPPVVTTSLNKDKGLVFDFSKTQTEDNQGPNASDQAVTGNIRSNMEVAKLNTTLVLAPQIRTERQQLQVTAPQEGGGNFVPEAVNPVFTIGATEDSSYGLSGRSRNTQHRSVSWTRKRRYNTGQHGG